MCTGVEIGLLLAAAVGTVATVAQGEATADAANAQAQQSLNEGAYRDDAAKAQAERIRRAGRAQRGEAKAALAASGAKLGEGTPLEIEKTIAERSEEDALSAILSGNRAQRSAREESDLFVKRGESARTSSYASAASTALGAYGKTGGWTSTIKAKPHAQNLGYAPGAFPQE